MREAPRSSRFAKFTLVVFGAGSIVVLGLEITERNGLISDLAESMSRLLVCLTLLGTLIWSARGLSRDGKLAIVVCSVFVAIGLSLEVIEDIRYLDELTLVGRNSHWRHFVEKAVVCCWTCGAFYVTYTLIRKSEESYRSLKTNEEELRDANKKLRNTLADLQDAQKQVIQQERLAALGQLASGVAHDLNNALTPVVLYTDSLLTHANKEGLHRAAEMIQSGVEHATQVIKQLQFFYRGHSDTVADDEIVGLGSVVNHAVELTRFRWHDEALKRGVNYKIDLDIQDECSVRGNWTELSQLLINLLMNAVDSMPDGGRITIVLKKQGRRIQLSVFDEGSGMSSEQRERCFEPFFTTKSAGSGLGLSVCHGIVTRHGGTIEARPGTLSGSCFVISLPYADNLDEQSGSEPSINSGSAVKPRRVLLIDDDERVRRSISDLLKSRGIEIDTADNGRIGIEMANSCSYDLIISDFAMPGMTGLDVVTSLKSSLPGVPIAIISGWSNRQIVEEFGGTDARPDFVLSKPLHVHEITDCLSRLDD
jgi:signal transduction histidine kinase